LTSLGVLPEHRGSGLSTAIVESFEREVRRRGFRRVRASTGFDNARSRAFYEKIGWVVEQSREDQNGIDFERVFTD
jgi:GNAT superfamily N-acetyltransferase